MQYNSYLVIYGASSGTQAPDGSYSPGAAGTPKYDGPCDAQEYSRHSGLVVVGDAGLQDTTAEIALYLKDESNITAIDIDDGGILTRLGKDFAIKVTEIRLLDGVVLVNTTGSAFK